MENIIISNQKFEYDHNPDTCPLCHHSMSTEPIFQYAKNIYGDNLRRGPIIFLLFQCPKVSCKEVFLARYAQKIHSNGQASGCWTLRELSPEKFKKIEHENEILEISPSFVSIFNQAHIAESYQLYEVVGGGYRKALEFLVKDFAMYNNPTDSANIKALQLAKVIGQYVDDPNVKECAKRASWLGNDELHYVRKWEEKDIIDLKKLIRLTEAWIHTARLTKKYLEEME